MIRGYETYKYLETTISGTKDKPRSILFSFGKYNKVETYETYMSICATNQKH